MAAQSTSSTLKKDDPSSRAELGSDILLLIFDLVRATSPKSLQVVALANSEFYHLAEYSRHRYVNLSLHSDTVVTALNRLQHMEKAGLLPAVRTLNVEDPGKDYPVLRQECDQYQSCIEAIGIMVPNMTGLRDVRWNYSSSSCAIMPDKILQVLRSCSKVRLHAGVNSDAWTFSNGELGPERILEKLQNNDNLSSLKTCITFTTGEECLQTTQPLKHILLSSPNIRSLALTVGQPKSGCVSYGPPRLYCGFGLERNESFPPLEELTITDYPWGEESTVTPGSYGFMPGLHQPGYPGKGSEIDHWAENFDWSRLRCLRTQYIDFALKLMPKLTSLKEVDLSGNWPKERIAHFYRECPASLEDITAESLESVSLAGMLRHGGTLRRLRLHTTEDHGGSWAEEAVTATRLIAIRDGCPLIEELFVDITRHDDWPWHTLDILASFKRLRTLTICFEVGVRCKHAPIKPFVTFTAADKIYKYLRAHSTRKPCVLSRLTIYAGAPPANGYGYPSPAALWPFNNSTQFICALSERDDEAARDEFELVCPYLPKDSQHMHDTLPSPDDGVVTEDIAMSYHVAHKGPVPMSRSNTDFWSRFGPQMSGL